MATKILIVEDEQKIARLVRLYLEEAGYSASVIADGSLAVPAFRHERPDLVILDLNLPGLDGLELGADDYVTKPFSPREIVARVRAVLRRTQGDLPAAETIRAGDLLIEPASRRVRIGEHELTLTVSEFDILAALARDSGRVLSRLQLLEASQGVAYEGYERSIDQHIKNLRRKIEDEAGHERIIQTVHGIGYRLDPVGG